MEPGSGAQRAEHSVSQHVYSHNAHGCLPNVSYGMDPLESFEVSDHHKSSGYVGEDVETSQSFGPLCGNVK